MIGLMVVLLVVLTWYGFSSVGGVSAILGNGYEIQGQNCKVAGRDIVSMAALQKFYVECVMFM